MRTWDSGTSKRGYPGFMPCLQILYSILTPKSQIRYILRERIQQSHSILRTHARWQSVDHKHRHKRGRNTKVAPHHSLYLCYPLYFASLWQRVCTGRVGKATAITTDNTNSKLKVTFYWPFTADYWIIALGPVLQDMYQWAVVGSPCRKYLWILSRSEIMDDFQFNEARDAALYQVKCHSTLPSIVFNLTVNWWVAKGFVTNNLIYPKPSTQQQHTSMAYIYSLISPI